MIEYPYLHESGKLPTSLAGVPFLTSVSAEYIDEVLKNTSVVECYPGDVLIEENQSDSGHFFILVKGAVTILKAGEEIGRIDTAGELIGELALLNEAEGKPDGTLRSATVRAADHTFCIKVDPDYLEDLSDKHREAYYAVLFRFIAGIMADRLAQANQRIADLEKTPARRVTFPGQFRVPVRPHSSRQCPSG